MKIKSFIGKSIGTLEEAMNEFIAGKKVLGVQYQIKQSTGDHCALVWYEE